MMTQRTGTAWSVLVATALTACLGSLAVALAGGSPSVAPPNPALVQYLENKASVSALQTAEMPDRQALGLVPPPLVLPAAKSTASLSSMPRLGYPAAYDLRTEGRVTPVRDQSSCGSCWAFATYGSLESCSISTGTFDFSENHIKNTHGLDWTCCEGGNSWISTAYLARWSGPVDEASDPYNPGSCTSPTGLTPTHHIQDVDFLPDKTAPLDNDSIKQAVMTYGAVYTSMYWGSSYHNYSTYAYYYNGSSYSNHAVSIVGWDDNFDRTRFVSTPPGNGAFLVKNSWGPTWGNNGYFYVSYYDSNFGKENVVFRSVEPTLNYNRIYQYDPFGWVNSIGYGTDTAWGANVFTAVGDDMLAAVSIYTASQNSSYEIRVYLDPTSGPINPAGYVASKSGVIAGMGYHTIALDTTISLTVGHKFSVVVRLTTPGYVYPIPIESPYAGYCSNATANAAESYISSTGSAWTDVTASVTNANVCIKAFTAETSGLLVTPQSGLDATGPLGGPFTPSSRVYTLTNNDTQTIEWSASRNQPWLDLSSETGTLAPGGSTSVTVSIGTSAATMPEGDYSGVVSFTNVTGGVGSTNRSVTLKIHNGSLSVTPLAGLNASGSPGGPFSPAGQDYTLSNTGYSSIAWTAATTQPWLVLSLTGGTLAPGSSAVVRVSIGSAADSLRENTYSDSVTFTNTTNGSGSTTRNVSLRVAQNYGMQPTTFSWVNPSLHTPLVLADDGVSAAQTIPFDFSFYGEPYTRLYVGANGLVGFGNSNLNAYSNTDIPTADLPNAVLYPYWDDLDPTSGGSVYVGTEGTSPDRRFVVSWVGVPAYASYAYLSFQVILCEGTNDIVFQYLEVQPTDMTYGAGRSATVGLEDGTGTLAHRYSFNGSTLLSNNQALIFSLPRRTSINGAKRLGNGPAVDIRNAVVTAVFSNLFYIESDDRSSGIGIVQTGSGLAPGQRTDVIGSLQTTASGERCIAPTFVSPVGSGSAGPLVLNNRNVGGADWWYDPVSGAGQQGVKDSIELNNIGLLISTTGRVADSVAPYFYIDDGSGIKDNSICKGIKVYAPGLSVPSNGSYVRVIGVSSCFKSGTDLYRLIRATQIIPLQ